MRSAYRPGGGSQKRAEHRVEFSVDHLAQIVIGGTQHDGLEKLSPPARRSGLIQDGNGCIGKRQNPK
jgi:hypothetical protein